ncbi:hypothetical protein [Streptomyces sp. NPDC048191]|uniref:hypothetical protein n=1 Tax=Streptomyces sp. NPDC048191 TaxID=3155484 RepID=UPI0033EAAAB4
MTSPVSFDDWYSEPDRLRDQLRQLLRYRATIALGVVLGLLGGLLLALSCAGSYTAAGDVLVRSTTDPFSPFGVSVDNQVSMGTERQMAVGAGVAGRAARALHQPADADTLLRNLVVSYTPNTQVLRFAYTAGSARRAARVTNAFLDAYLADRKARTDGVAKRMTSGAQEQLTELAEQKKKQKDDNPGLLDQINVLQKRITDIKSRDTTGGEIVRRATPPAHPAGPGPATPIGLGVLGGLLLGVGLAWLRAGLEPRARSIGEVQGALGAPVLGILPGAGTPGDLLEVGRTGGGRAETYRALAFRLRHGGNLAPGGTLLLVAPKRDRNTEAAAVNLAAALAEDLDDVLLVDATGCVPGLAQRLPLAGAASGDATESSAGLPEGPVVVDAGTAGRFTLVPGQPDTATGDIARAPMVTRVLSATEQPALVVTRPLLEHTDGLAVAQRVDAVLVVAGLDRTRRDDLRRVRELLSCAGGRVVGAVVATGSPRRALLGIQRLRPVRREAPAAPGMPSQAQPDSSVQESTLTASQG